MTSSAKPAQLHTDGPFAERMTNLLAEIMPIVSRHLQDSEIEFTCLLSQNFSGGETHYEIASSFEDHEEFCDTLITVTNDVMEPFEEDEPDDTGSVVPPTSRRLQ